MNVVILCCGIVSYSQSIQCGRIYQHKDIKIINKILHLFFYFILMKGIVLFIYYNTHTF
jgi:hypothetical protein